MLNLTQGRRKTADQGTPIPTPFKTFAYNGIHFRRGGLSLVAAAPGGGKALALDTPIPTPSGWSTMGDLQVGDEVIGSDGEATRVVATTGVMTGRDVYRVSFDDGTSVLADADHQWVPESRSYRAGKTKRRPTLTTVEMMETLTVEGGARLNYSIPLTVTQGADANLPIDPYILGYWLGDGTTGKPQITVWKDDLEHLMREVSRAGLFFDFLITGESSVAMKISTRKYDGHSRNVRNGFRSALSGLGVLHEKRIPRAYLRASVQQRRRLLAGLMDSDGWNKESGQPVLTLTSEGLFNDAVELIRSLGFKPSVSTKQCAGATVETSTARTAGWSADVPVFTLPRKAEKHRAPARPSTQRRSVVSVEQVESVPVRCIQVEAEDSIYLCGEGFVQTHNSALVQNIVQRGNDEGHRLPTLYFSADSDATTMFTRSAAMATGYEMGEVERLMEEGGQEMLEERVRQASAHVQYSFQSTLDYDAIEDELQAYALVHGAWPQVIVADNLMNIDSGFEDEFRGLGEASFFLLNIARDTGAAVIALHHVGGEHEGGGAPIPLSGLRGKVSKLPALILTLHRADGMRVSVVKNRSGKSDPSGNYGVSLRADLARMTITD